jgi:hypothetical protein
VVQLPAGVTGVLHVNGASREIAGGAVVAF